MEPRSYDRYHDGYRSYGVGSPGRLLGVLRRRPPLSRCPVVSERRGGSSGREAFPSWRTSCCSQLLQISPVFPERGATVDFTTNFSPTLLNDFAFTATEDIVHVNLDIGKGLDRGSLGVNFPYVFGTASKDIAG